MEPRARPEEEVIQDGARFRWRLMAACMLLIGLAMTQSPGLLVADTKLDLAIAPFDFLARAAHLWDGEGAFGQLQNQAYGYLWPMGPFFALGSLLDLPGWVIQRLWVALGMCVAFVGAAKVARSLGVRSDLACILGGIAFALSPRMLTVLGPSSIEVWPAALAPWVLLPLVVGASRGSAIRAAALSALAITMVGGVNAAATSAVLPLGALWLLGRAPGPRRRTLMLWWPVFTLLGTLWWLIPLFLLGGYSPPFLDYIESAANTTFPTTLFDALRGTSNWVPYVDTTSRAGNDLLRQSHLVANSAVVMLLGLVGLTLRRNLHRGFLLSGVLVGMFLVTMGHLGDVQGGFAPALRDLLDGPLAPLRNVHKFDPVLRLPMVLGLAFAVDELVDRRRRAAQGTGPDARSERVTLQGMVAICVLAVIGAALPAALGRITPAGGFADIPEYWVAAADWLEGEQDQGTALLVPGSSFGTYVWGSPRDEPFQSLATKPWAVRNAVPLAPAGNIRMLDSVESRLSQGRGGAGLARLLARSGVSHLVVRNDLTRSGDVPDPVLVHQALADSPGLRLVQTFGPDIGGAPVIEGELGKAMVNGGWQEELPALEIFAVDVEVSRVSGTDSPTVVVGGPEDLADLAELGVLGTAPARLAADDPEVGPGDRVVLTDGMRAVERNFGRLHDATSETRVDGQARKLPSRSLGYELADPERWSTRAELLGARAVTASSSQSDANAQGLVVPGAQPYAAIDDDPLSAWISGPGSVLGHWWQLDLQTPRQLGQISITVAGEGREVLQIRTNDWTSPVLNFEAGEPRRISVPGATRVLRIEDQSGRSDNRLALADVSIPGLRVTRTLVMPDLPSGSGTPAAIVIRRLSDERSGCARIEEAVRCRAGQSREAEEPLGFARRFTLPESMTSTPSITVSANPGDAWDDYLFYQQPISATASSSVAPDPRARASAAIDGRATTTWTAELSDTRPELRLAWLGRYTITGLAFSVEPGAAARIPEVLELSWPGGTREVSLGKDGTVRFPPIRTSQLTLKVLEAEPATDIAFDGSASFVPVGISELRLTGLPLAPLLLPDTVRATECGDGPLIRIDGRTYETRVRASVTDLYDGGTGTAELCGTDEVTLPAGVNDVEVEASGAFVVDSLVLQHGTLPTGEAKDLASSMEAPTSLSVEAPQPGEHLATSMNANRGWTLLPGSGDAQPVTYDGWRQGWMIGDEVPAVLEARFTPDRAYRAGLVAGLLALLALLIVMVLPRRGRSRRDAPPLSARRVSPVLVAVLGILSGWMLAGAVGAGVAASAALAGGLAHRRAPLTGAIWLSGALLLPAAGAYLVRPWGSAAGWAGSWAWPHYLVLAACAVVLGAIAADSSRRQRSETPLAGTSTSR